MLYKISLKITTLNKKVNKSETHCVELGVESWTIISMSHDWRPNTSSQYLLPYNLYEYNYKYQIKMYNNNLCACTYNVLCA